VRPRGLGLLWTDPSLFLSFNKASGKICVDLLDSHVDPAVLRNRFDDAKSRFLGRMLRVKGDEKGDGYIEVALQEHVPSCQSRKTSANDMITRGYPKLKFNFKEESILITRYSDNTTIPF
jgi:hypothetical protein